jgi:hypothetical protein
MGKLRFRERRCNSGFTRPGSAKELATVKL